MGIRNLIQKLTGGQKTKGSSRIEDYVELQVQGGGEQHEAPGRYVKVFKLKGFADVDVAATELSDGNIIILDIKPLAERSMNELKHAVDEMKNTVLAMGGDIAGLSEYHLIMTPPGVKVERTGESRAQTFEETMDRVRSSMGK
ncbi:MAG: cell division protein SepF [Candidatus Hydrothermarchaeota archaeon]